MKLEEIPFAGFPFGIAGCGLFSSPARTRYAGKSYNSNSLFLQTSLSRKRKKK